MLKLQVPTTKRDEHNHSVKIIMYLPSVPGVLRKKTRSVFSENRGVIVTRRWFWWLLPVSRRSSFLRVFQLMMSRLGFRRTREGFRRRCGSGWRRARAAAGTCRDLPLACGGACRRPPAPCCLQSSAALGTGPLRANCALPSPRRVIPRGFAGLLLEYRERWIKFL